MRERCIVASNEMNRPNILFAEDDKESQIITCRILEKAGYTVDCVDNGRQAVDAVQSCRYDLVLMDIEMPEMGGLEAAKKIRQSLSGKGVPIIAFTALSGEDLARQCLSTGMNDVLHKPLEEQGFLECIDKWLNKRPSILVVDDSGDNSRLLEHFLKETPYSAVFAKNGIEAISAYGNSRHISLILMDMEMPVMDGYTATRALRSLMGQNTVPIIAMTAHEGETEIAKCLKAGCTGYVSKPITPQTLQHALSIHLQIPAARSGQTVYVPSERPVVHIDPDIAALVPRFLNNRRKDTLEINRLLAEGNIEAIRIIGHSMAGSAGGYGFPEIGKIGKAIENAARDTDHRKIKECTAQLSAYLSTVTVISGNG